ISERVFSYDLLDYDKTILNNLCNILDKGYKFVPNLITNEFEYFVYLQKEIDNALLNLNGNIFFNKVNNLENNNNSIDLNDDNYNYNYISKLRRKRSINYKSIPIQRETIDLRFELYNKVFNN